MNLSILKTEVQNFIKDNLNNNITKLVLKGSPYPEVSTKELIEQIESKSRSKKKLPHWFNTLNIYYPNKLNIEQTSSEETALYKSNLIQGETIIDITGGFGVDCWAFSKNFKQVVHCELNSSLSKIVEHNINQLNITNIKTYNGNGIEHVINNNTKYDWLYVDPSRRNDLKGKVFLLKDCLPNVPLHLNNLLEKSDNILIKNSPLIDLTSCIKELNYVKQIHIIALKNEVKEVLVHIEKNYSGNINITATNIDKEISSFNFTYKKEYLFNLSKPLQYLFEPNASILKAGGFNAIANKLNLTKLHNHSHLYTSDILVKFPGRSFQIKDVLPYNKKQILKKIPQKKANITTRNFKETVASIRKKTGLKDGGNIYLFFTTNLLNEQIVIFCDKVT